MEIAEVDKVIGAIVTLEKALTEIQKQVYVVDTSLRNYAIRKGNFDSDLLELLTTSHVTWRSFDDLIDSLREKQWDLKDWKKKYKTAHGVKGLQDSRAKNGKRQVSKPALNIIPSPLSKC